jgi:hypothetical protein
VGEQVRAIVERQPEKLSATPRGDHRSAGQPIDEVVRSPRVAAERAISEDLDRRDLAADHPSLEAATHGLDFRKLRH